MKKIGLLSDTHSYLHPKVFKHFGNCDEIWHAGDIGSLEVLNELENFKKTRAVYGNIDNHKIRIACKKNLFFEIEGVYVFMTHIGGYPPKYTPAIKEILERKKPKLFVCGHSHILKVIFDKQRNILHMNPGAAGKYGIHHVITLLRFELMQGEIKNLEVIEIEKN